MREMKKLVQYSGYGVEAIRWLFIPDHKEAQVVGVRYTLERARTLRPHTTGSTLL